jgi:hypothetical protein
MYSLRLCSVLFGIIAVAEACAAQSDCLKRTIPVGAYTKDGSLAPNLSPANLAGTYQKRPVAVRSVQVPEKLPRIILLIDTSGSMRRWSDVTIDAAEGMLFKLPPEIEVGLVFFAQTTIPVQLPTTDRKAAMAQLEALRKNIKSWRGKTAFRAALNDSIKMFGSPAAGDAIYVVSDADDNASRATERQVREGIANAEVRVYALKVVPKDLRSYRSPQEIASSDDLEYIVEVSGGTIIYKTFPGPDPPHELPLLDKRGNPTQLARDLERQLRQFLNFYRVEIELPETVDKPRDWKLDLTGIDRSQQQILTLTYPTLLTPCH